MTDRDTLITDDELHAYVDGELSPERRKIVEAWLATHPDDAARVASWRAHAELIRIRYGGVAHTPVPPRLDVDRLARNQRRWTLAAAAAVVIAFVSGGAAGWFGRGAIEPPGPPPRTVTAEALEAHKLYIAEVRHPIEVPATASHLNPWLSRRVLGTPTSLRAPDLSAFELKLMGGRLLPWQPGKPAALFMYENAAGERYTLYAARVGGPETSLHYDVSGQVAAVYWGDGELRFVVSGPADRERLLKIGQAAYEQLDRRTSRGGST
jgi:anti-sigma factor RsiW